MKNIWVVYCKELLDTIRDRRTIISMIIVPVFVFPLLTLGFSSFAAGMVKKSADEIHRVAVIGSANASTLYSMIEKSDKVSLVTVNPDSIESAINDKIIRAALIIPHGFDTHIVNHERTGMIVVSNQADTRSVFAAERLNDIVDEYHQAIIESRLTESGMDTGIINPFEVETKNVSEKKMGSFLLSMFVPYIIIILCMVGAMYTAIDLTAGEKERGTLETILVSPIPRWHLATGKYLTILTTSIVSTLLVMGSMTVTTMYLGTMASSGLDELISIQITPTMILVIFLMMIPTACLLSALIMGIAMFAKSHKEAQSYISPLMFIVIVPALVSFIPGIELSLQLSFVPLVNICLSIKEALMGNINWLYVAIIFLSTVLYAGFAIFIAHRLYEKESVLFRI